MIGDAEAKLVDGIFTLRIDLRPPDVRNRPEGGAAQQGDEDA